MLGVMIIPFGMQKLVFGKEIIKLQRVQQRNMWYITAHN